MATAPKGYARRPPLAPGLIAVAYDGTPEPEAALGYAEALALSTGARMRLLTAAVIAATRAGMLGYAPPMPKPPAELLADGLATLDPEVDAKTRMLSDHSIAGAIVAPRPHREEMNAEWHLREPRGRHRRRLPPTSRSRAGSSTVAACWSARIVRGARC